MAPVMPAVPAWPPRSLARLFVEQLLSNGASVELEGKPAHYLGTVLRMGEGAELLLFDGESGEWKARIVTAGKKRLTLQVLQRTRPAEVLPPLTLAFTPVKRGPLDWLVEKATELGVGHLQPVITRRTVVDRLNFERLRSITIEAAEQCGRTRLPSLAEPLPLERLLNDHAGLMLFADETGGAPFLSALRPGPCTVLIGPEGGFTPEERERILNTGAQGVSLGPRVLRAETAALAGVSLYMAGAGDWR